MEVMECVPGDRATLAERIRGERRAVHRDRFRAVAMALDGRAKMSIAEALGRSKSFVETWVYAYRDGGLEAIRVKRPPGRPPLLPKAQEEAFCRRVEDGPREDDGVCTLRGVDLQRILREEFGATYSERGVYALMKRLSFSSLTPRPIHEKHDPAAAEDFKRSAPFLFTPRRPSIPANGYARC